MNYNETLDYLFARLPMFQRSGLAAYKNSLENTLALDAHYKYPHTRFKTIHVAGTNGKGSVSHMLAAILQTAGFKVGLYTSPHLKDFRERIRVNGEMIKKQELVVWVQDYRKKNELWKLEPSFFELTVALAFDYFAKQQVDIAVVEVGLGGRLDSTNIINPELSLITNIGLDHTNLLGKTRAEIALEKAGIIKQNTPVVIGTTQHQTTPIFTEVAQTKQAPLFFADQHFAVEYSTLGVDGLQTLSLQAKGKPVYPNLKLDLLGTYQHHNVPLVLMAVKLINTMGINIAEEHLYEGLANVVEKTALLGRWQVLGSNPLVICDTGHNEDGIRAVVEQINNTAYKHLHFVFGTVADKNPARVLALLPKNASYYFAKANIPRAMDAEELAEKAKHFGLMGQRYGSVKEAFKEAKTRAKKEDLIFVGGSTFVVAEVL